MVSLQGLHVANRWREESLESPLVDVHASFLPIVFLVNRRIKNST